MALNKEILKQDIIQIMNDMKNKEKDAVAEFADRLSTAIDEYVRQMSIQYVTGLANSGGPVIGVAQFSIS